MRVSLPLRINLISLVFAALVASVLTLVGGIFLYQQQQEGAIVRARLAGDELASRAERLLALQLGFPDFLDFDEQCAAVIRSDPQLRAAALFNAQGVQKHHSSGQRMAWPSGETLPDVGGSLVLLTPSGRIVMQPVVQGNDKVAGYTIIAIDGGAVLQATLRPIGWLVLSSLVLFVVGLIIQQCVFWRAVGYPLEHLVRTADELRPGDPVQIAALQHYTDQNDIGRVFGALARLMLRLQDARNELVAQNVELEVVVRERTEQLEQANLELARDIERRKALEEELRTLASTDALTGLANRAFILPYLERRLEHARRNPGPLGVVVLDFDGFKAINDTYGHAIGDQVLQVMGHRIQQVCRQSDVLARLGGDEFLIVFEAFLDDSQADALCRRLAELFETPLQIGALKLRLGASIGAALFPRNGSDLVTLMAAADSAMYEAKANGGGYRFAHPSSPVVT